MPDSLVVNEQPVQLVVGNQPLGPASGDLVGYYPAPTVAKVAGVTPGAEGLVLLATNTPVEVLARIALVDGVNSKLDADLVVSRNPRSSSFGTYPSASSAIAAVPDSPSSTFARFCLGA